ncbi:hypothetical protein [Sporosarcina sp. 6E9]|uniref:hypothetical protein n=1 Tax=Sporosarcina sp. 6E9 TaxID=2819235 RepID=UPI001B304DC0|nr:hypothetical protein [Sporosarcina sp. 6E9]
MNNIFYFTMVILIFLSIVIGYTILAIKIAKGPKKLFLGTKYFGFKKISLNFTLFNTFFMRNFLVQPNVTYQVIYKLETKEGDLTMSLDNQLFDETTSSTEGTCFMEFNKIKPVLKLVGTHAKDGRAEVKLIKQ